MNTIDITEIPDSLAHRREFIKYQLLIRGYSLAKLAREHGKTRQQPINALVMSYPKWEHIIAEKLGVKPHHLWPERYDEYGIPLRQMGRPKKSGVTKSNNTTRKQSRNVQSDKSTRHGKVA